MKRLGSDSETVPKPNVLLVDHMYGERQEQWQTLRAVVVKYQGATIFIIFAQ